MNLLLALFAGVFFIAEVKSTALQCVDSLPQLCVKLCHPSCRRSQPLPPPQDEVSLAAPNRKKRHAAPPPPPPPYPSQCVDVGLAYDIIGHLCPYSCGYCGKSKEWKVAVKKWVAATCRAPQFPGGKSKAVSLAIDNDDTQ